MKKREVLSKVAGYVGEVYYEVRDWLLESDIRKKKIGLELEIPIADEYGEPISLYDVSFIFPKGSGGIRNIVGWDGSGKQFEIRFPPARLDVWFSDIMVARIMNAVRFIVAVAGAQGYLVPWNANLAMNGVHFPVSGAHVHFSWGIMKELGILVPRKIVDVVRPAVEETKRWVGDRYEYSGCYGRVDDWRGQRHGIEVRGFESIYWSEMAVVGFIWNIVASLWAYKEKTDPPLVSLSPPEYVWLNYAEPFESDILRMKRCGSVAREAAEEISVCRIKECGELILRLMERYDPDVTIEYLRKIRPRVFAVKKGDVPLGVLMYDVEMGRVVVPSWMGSEEELLGALWRIVYIPGFYEVVIEDEKAEVMKKCGFRFSESTVLVFLS